MDICRRFPATALTATINPANLVLTFRMSLKILPRTLRTRLPHRYSKPPLPKGHTLFLILLII
jgi:hypothetical protein